MTQNHRYPALLLDRLTPLYDLFARLFMPETRFKRDLIASAHISSGQLVLDMGAGTGTLAILIKQIHPEAQVIGLDGDPEILSIARQKAARSGVDVVFEPGNATALPYASQTFDRVLSTLVMSVLNSEEKLLAVQAAYRVLSRGGGLRIADFGRPHTRWARFIAPRMRRFDPIAANLDGLLPVMLRQAGYVNIAEPACYATLLGTISILTGQKP